MGAGEFHGGCAAHEFPSPACGRGRYRKAFCILMSVSIFTPKAFSMRSAISRGEVSVAAKSGRSVVGRSGLRCPLVIVVTLGVTTNLTCVKRPHSLPNAEAAVRSYLMKYLGSTQRRELRVRSVLRLLGPSE